MLLATAPLLTLVLALVHRQERFRWPALVGGVPAVGGIAVVFGTGLDARVPLASMLALVAGAACWANAPDGAVSGARGEALRGASASPRGRPFNAAWRGQAPGEEAR